MQLVKRGKSIHFIVPSEIGISPGQRFRFEHYLPILRERGYIVKVSPFFSISQWKTLYKHGKLLNKVFSVIKGLFRRLSDTIQSLNYDYVFIYREASPLGPPIFEWLLCKVLRKKVVYDFDDAIWIPQTSLYNKNIIALKWYSKVSYICKWAHQISIGNEFLKQFALNYSNEISIIPTVVDTKKTHNRLQEHDTSTPAIGWTGTFSTLKYLKNILPAIAFLQVKYQFNFYVIADTDPKLDLKNYIFIKWNKETEISDILRFHIGIMPLTDDDISRGKCGFKAIQYMSLGIPAVASPIGVNISIIDDGLNGYLCNDDNDWIKSIEALLTNPQLRENMGLNARKKIEQHYSVESTTEKFIQLFT